MTLEFERAIAAPPARVFAAVTEAAGLTQWFSHAAESDPRPGGALRLTWTGPEASAEPFVGRWVEVEAPRRAVFEGGRSGYPRGTAGRVAIDVEADGTGARVRVRHELPDDVEFAGLAGVWAGAWMRALDRLSEAMAA